MPHVVFHEAMTLLRSVVSVLATGRLHPEACRAGQEGHRPQAPGSREPASALCGRVPWCAQWRLDDRLPVTVGERAASCSRGFLSMSDGAAGKQGSQITVYVCVLLQQDVTATVSLYFQNLRAAVLKCQLALNNAGFGLCVSTYTWIVFIDPINSNLRCSRVAWWLGIRVCGGAT